MSTMNPSETAQTDIADDRRQTRIHCRLTVQLSANGIIDSGVCWNLSETGMFIACDSSDFPQGEIIDFSLVLSDQCPVLIDGIGRIVWVNPVKTDSGLPPGIGVHFERIDEADAAAIMRFIHAG